MGIFSSTDRQDPPAIPSTSLPVELVALVIEQVGSLCKDDAPSRRANGLACALVCKAWRPYGTALVWDRVVVRSHLMFDKLLDYLEERPYAAARLRALEYTKHEGSTAPSSTGLTPFPTPAEFEELRRNPPPTKEQRFFAVCTGICELVFVGGWQVVERHLEAIVLSSNGHLLRKLDCLDEAHPGHLLHYLPFFPNLRELTIEHEWPGARQRPRPRRLPPLPADPPLLRLRTLAIPAVAVDEDGFRRPLSDYFDPAYVQPGRSTFLSQLLALVDPSTVVSAELFLDAADKFPLDWLDRCNVLRILELQFRADQNPDSLLLRRTLDLLDSLDRITRFTIHAFRPEGWNPPTGDKLLPLDDVLWAMEGRRWQLIVLMTGVSVCGREGLPPPLVQLDAPWAVLATFSVLDSDGQRVWPAFGLHKEEGGEEKWTVEGTEGGEWGWRTFSIAK